MGPRQHTRPEGHPSPPPPFWEAFGCVLYYATRAEMVPGRREDTALLYRLDNPKAAASLFAGWEETMLWSCLSGVMGEIYAAAPEAPSSAAAALGDFFFFAGEADRELVVGLPPCRQRDYRILVPQNEAWAGMIEDCWGERARRRLRYAVKKEPGAFDRAGLAAAVATLPRGFLLRPLDEELYHRCGAIPWCRDWVAQYPSYSLYRRYGLGVVVLRQREPVAGASSYSGWPGGIEVEIDTREDCRRQGLAYAAGAALILACLERGWYPSWDAHNPESAALAEKLGYHISHRYLVYEAEGPAPAIEG